MNKGLHRFTVFVTCATFFLIVAGALVTSHDAGLAAPDWPLSYGQVFPKMVGNLFWEHGHRMIATTVGFLTIILNIWLWRREPRAWVRKLGFVALLAVIAQGLLGGLTVVLLLPLWVSTAHACLAQLFFCTMVSLSVFTAPGWQQEHEAIEESGGLSVRHLCIASFAMTFVQLALGATLRHSATWDQHLPTNLLLAHVSGAVLVTLILGYTVFVTLHRHGDRRYLARPARLALIVLGLQLVLGVLTFLARRASPDDPQPLNPMISLTVAHVACGALVLALTVILGLRAFRLLKGSQTAAAAYSSLNAARS
ncbi:MAG TPA: COX15/CtaA family protein [Pyrinomonadaceae bacterium]|jgi:cytochrome c oxidase assembly protein subunit 15